MSRFFDLVAVVLLVLFIVSIVVVLVVLGLPLLPIDPWLEHLCVAAREDIIPLLILDGVLLFVLGALHAILTDYLRYPRVFAVLAWPLFIVFAVSNVLVAASNVLPLIEIPARRNWRIVEAPFVKVEMFPSLAWLGGLPLPNFHGAWMLDDPQNTRSRRDQGEYSAEQATFVLLQDNVLAIDRSTRWFVFEKPLAGLRDFIVVPKMLFVVVGRTLAATDGKGGTVKVSDLPGENFRFGQRVGPNGLSSELMLFGNTDRGGEVFLLRPEGEVVHVLNSVRPVSAATGAFRTTAVAIDDRVLLLTPGQRPRMLFRVPVGSTPVTSMLARVKRGGTEADVLYLIGTRNGVFAVQQGIAHLALAGLGGELRSDDPVGLNALLFDPLRRAAVRLSFDYYSEHLMDDI